MIYTLEERSELPLLETELLLRLSQLLVIIFQRSCLDLAPTPVVVKRLLQRSLEIGCLEALHCSCDLVRVEDMP